MEEQNLGIELQEILILLKENQIRPTLMQLIWKMGGFSLGFFTAILGKKTAMACTTAVEEVIEEHYQQQINILSAEIDKQENIEQKSDMSNLVQKITEFQADEVHHRDIAYDNKAKESPIFTPLTHSCPPDELRCNTICAISPTPILYE